VKEKMLIAASLGALALAIFLFARILAVKRDFDATVRESYRTTEGYDQQFIDRVNRFEQVLVNRATFGYPGGKDPMTGAVRRLAAEKTATGTAAPKMTHAPLPAGTDDALRLAAVISYPQGQKRTALIMQGDRSFTVDAGDAVPGGRVAGITHEGILIDRDNGSFFYNINGTVEKRSGGPWPRPARAVRPAPGDTLKQHPGR
jgi:Tfp pilus assembly protein PilP